MCSDWIFAWAMDFHFTALPVAIQYSLTRSRIQTSIIVRNPLNCTARHKTTSERNDMDLTIDRQISRTEVHRRRRLRRQTCVSSPRRVDRRCCPPRGVSNNSHKNMRTRRVGCIACWLLQLTLRWCSVFDEGTQRSVYLKIRQRPRRRMTASYSAKFVAASLALRFQRDVSGAGYKNKYINT